MNEEVQFFIDFYCWFKFGFEPDANTAKKFAEKSFNVNSTYLFLFKGDSNNIYGKTVPFIVIVFAAQSAFLSNTTTPFPANTFYG